MLFKQDADDASNNQFTHSLAITTLGLALCFSQVCSADLSDLKVYSPIVEKGEMGIENFGEYHL